MALRGLVAIVLGLIVGAVVGLSPVLVRSQAIPDAADIPVVALAIGAAIFLTVPGWGLSCAIILPIVTHRTLRDGMLAPVPYFASAASIGAIAVLPTYILVTPSDPSVLAVMVPAGVAGGLAIALMWHLLILKPIAARRAPAYGASLG